MPGIDANPIVWVIVLTAAAVLVIGIARTINKRKEKIERKKEREELLRPGREAARAARMKRKNR